MRVSSRKVAAFHAVEVPRMDSVSRWVGGPPFCCWWAEVRSRERGQGQIDSRDSGVASVRASGPLCPWPLAPGAQAVFLQDSKTPRPQLQAVSPPEEPQSRSGLSIKPMSLLGMWYLHYRSTYLGICFFHWMGCSLFSEISKHSPSFTTSLHIPSPTPTIISPRLQVAMPCTARTAHHSNLNTTASPPAPQTPTRHPPIPPSASS